MVNNIQMYIYFFFLFVPSTPYKCKRPDFTQIFVDSVDSLNSPVYFAPPCNYVNCAVCYGDVAMMRGSNCFLWLSNFCCLVYISFFILSVSLCLFYVWSYGPYCLSQMTEWMNEWINEHVMHRLMLLADLLDTGTECARCLNHGW